MTTFSLSKISSNNNVECQFLPYPNPESWMGENWGLVSDKLLASVCFPASHDSGMFGTLETTSLTTEKKVKTQEKDIERQLEQGIRMFDMRPAWLDGEFYMTHNSNVAEIVDDNIDRITDYVAEHCGQGVPGALLKPFIRRIGKKIGVQGGISISCSLIAVFDQLNNYFKKDSNRNELVILDFSHFINWESRDSAPELTQQLKDRFVGLIMEKLGSLLLSRPVSISVTNLASLTLSELINSGNIIVRLPKGFVDHQKCIKSGVQCIWDETNLPIRGGYSNTNDISLMISKQLENLEETVTSRKNGIFLFGLSWQLTLQGVQNLPWNESSLLSLASQANEALCPTLDSWLIDKKLNSQIYPNYIQTDACNEKMTKAVSISIEVCKVISSAENRRMPDR